MSGAGSASFAQYAAPETTDIKRIVLSSIIGTAVEWYDFLIYGTASAPRNDSASCVHAGTSPSRSLSRSRDYN